MFAREYKEKPGGVKPLAGSDSTQFIPAEIDLYGSQCTVLGAIVDELPDGRLGVILSRTYFFLISPSPKKIGNVIKRCLPNIMAP